MARIIQPQTGRLLLRQWRDEDRAPFAEMNADPRVMEYFPATQTRQESDASVDRAGAHIAEHGWGFWALERREDNRFMGFVGIKNVSDDLPFAPAVEIGWRLGVPYWGRGYATEAARASLDVAFQTLGLDEVVSFAVVNNRPSRAVMERLGMREDPQIFEHPRLPHDSPLRRHCLYRLNAPDWRSLQS